MELNTRSGRHAPHPTAFSGNPQYGQYAEPLTAFRCANTLFMLIEVRNQLRFGSSESPHLHSTGFVRKRCFRIARQLEICMAVLFKCCRRMSDTEEDVEGAEEMKSAHCQRDLTEYHRLTSLVNNNGLWSPKQVTIADRWQWLIHPDDFGRAASNMADQTVRYARFVNN